MRKQGINMEQVKKENRSLILKCINNNGPLSRKDIASITGLTAASVTQITTQLISESVLIELGSVGEGNGLAGRKKILLDINPDLCSVLSINIESETTTIAICANGGGALCHTQIPTGRDAESLLEKIAAESTLLLKCLSEADKNRLRCACVGIPGIVDKENGVSVHAYGIWESEVNVRDILSQKLNLDIPVIVENNVDAFANAEILFGAGRQYDSLLVIKWGPGVGSTIVVDSKVYQGRHGKTAELGHFIVQKNGKKCSCGRRGCLETMLSYSALSDIAAFTSETFGETYEGASDDAKAKFDSAIDLFARSIVNAGTLIAPNRIILSGSLFKSKIIRRKLIEACSVYDSSYNENRIYYTSLSSKESYIGPVATYIKQFLMD